MSGQTAEQTPVTEAPAPKAPKPKAPAKGSGKANGKPKARKAAGAKAAKARKAKAAQAARVTDPTKLDAFGFRKGSLRSQAVAMYASKKGATLGEVRNKLESTQFNVLTQLEEAGFKIERSQEDGNGNRKVTRYKVYAKAK